MEARLRAGTRLRGNGFGTGVAGTVKSNCHTPASAMHGPKQMFVPVLLVCRAAGAQNLSFTVFFFFFFNWTSNHVIGGMVALPPLMLIHTEKCSK